MNSWMKKHPPKYLFVTADNMTAIDYVNPLNGCRGVYSNETLEQVQVRYPGAKRMEIDAHIQAKETALCAPPPTEITEEKYWDMLEALPPQNWVRRKGASTFEFLEALSGRVTTICCEIATPTGKRFFSLNGIAGTPHEQIVKRCRDFMEGLQHTGVELAGIPVQRLHACDACGGALSDPDECLCPNCKSKAARL